MPVLNEAELIRPCLQQLRQHAAAAEIIVVDGDSSDGTAELAAGLCNQVLSSAPGRARQMNAGAQASNGDVLWFLHADASVPATCMERINRALQNPDVVGGFFRIRLSGSNPVYRLTDSFSHYAGLLLRLRYADHGFFCTREVFNQLGGFPEIELMEDAEFFRALRRAGKVQVIRDRIVTSPRRYERVGATRLTAAYGLISVLYLLGVSPKTLSRAYRRLCATPVRKA